MSVIPVSLSPDESGELCVGFALRAPVRDYQSLSHGVHGYVEEGKSDHCQPDPPILQRKEDQDAYEEEGTA